MITTFKNRISTLLIFVFFAFLLTSCEENQLDIFGEAKVKIVNAAAHSKTQQFFFIGGIIANDLDYSESTNSYITVKSGDKLVAQFKDQRDGNILASANIDLQNKDRYTLYLAEDNSGRERIYSFKDDFSAPAKGRAKIKFIHLSGKGPSEITFFDNTNSASFANISRNNQSPYYEVNSGSLSISAKGVGQSSTLISINTPQLMEGKIYTFVLTTAFNNGYDLLLIKHN